MTEQEEVWPPPIQRRPKVIEQNSPHWVRCFALSMSFVYLLFIPFLFCLLVPSVRGSIEQLEMQFEWHRNAPPYDLPLFHFTAGCFVVMSILGGMVSGFRFLVAASRCEPVRPSAVSFVISVLPGSVSYYLAYLELAVS